MASLVETIMELRRQLVAARRPADKTLLARQIDATNRQIDRAVYRLYGLTDKEIAIIEQAAE